MQYFELTPDYFGPYPVQRWHLTMKPELPDGNWWDVWAFRQCRLSSPPPYPFTVLKDGPPCEINITGAFSILVVTQRVAAAIERVAGNEIQRVPAKVEHSPIIWEIINPLLYVSCLDERKSLIESYFPDDFKRPELAGKPRGVIRLRVDPEKAAGHHVFRISNWSGPVIVSQTVADALLALKPEGCRLDPVTE